MNAGRCTNGNARDRVVISTRIEQFEPIVRKIMSATEALDYDETDRFAVRLALEEALANAAVHGNGNDPEKSITVEWQADAARITIEVQDEGEGFDPSVVPDPTAEENLEIPAGRGLTIIHAYMTNVQIIPPGNCVCMTYERPRVS